MFLTKEELAAYEQQCRENREAWERDQSGRSLVGSPFLVTEEGAGGTTSAGQAVRGARRERKSKGDEEVGKEQRRTRSAERIAEQLQAQASQAWVPERRAKRRPQSAERLVEQMMGQPADDDSPAA